MTPAWPDASRYDPPSWVAKRFGDVDGRGVRIAMVDSGWDRTVPFTPSTIQHGLSLIGDTDSLSTDDQDRHGHGTECTWLAARVAPGASLTPVRIFDKLLTTSVTALARALEWAIEQRFDVVSLSLGTGEPSAMVRLYALCERAREENVLVIASMDPSGSRPYPAAFDNVLSAKSGTFMHPFEFVYCPGETTECYIGRHEVVVTSLGGKTRSRQGASFATPQLVGLAALVREAHPGITLGGLREVLAECSLPPAPNG